MLKVVLKSFNYAVYLIGCSVFGDWFAKFYYGLFGFITDADYAEQHPKMYIAKLIGVMVIGIVLATAVVWYPLTCLMEWLNKKIDKHFDDKDEKDDWLD